MPGFNLRNLLLGLTALLLLAWLTWLGLDAWHQLNSLQTEANVAPPAPVSEPRATPDPLAIAQLFGLMPQDSGESIPEVPLTLLAILQASVAEQSRALIASPEGSRFYRIGETLPGGGVLRQIDASRVLIQRLGSEQTLPLNVPRSNLLTPSSEPDQQPADVSSGRLVQPFQ